MFELWARDRYFPIFYSREKIDSVTESTLMLQPVGRTSQGGRQD